MWSKGTQCCTAEADFLDELNVALEKLQDTVDKMRLENAETNKKVDKLQSEMTIMKEANSKSFEKLDQLNKMINRSNSSIGPIEHQPIKWTD